MRRLSLLIAASLVAGCSAEDNGWNRLWLTADQRGDRPPRRVRTTAATRS